MEILYQDARILVCIKPAGVLSTDESGAMPSLLRAALGDSQACVKTVHRLDAAVSGVMVYARSHKAASILSEQIRSGAFQKEYLAVLCGTIAEKEGVLEDSLHRDRYTGRSRVCAPEEPEAQKAVLSYRVLAEQGGLSLVSIRLQTGRTHQIRVQFASRGLPLYGDRKYGTAAADTLIALWSYRLSFLHPQSLHPVTFSHEAPACFPWTCFEKRDLP